MDEVVVTIKMDGENTTIYPDGYIHARSLDGTGKPWQKEVKALACSWWWQLPLTWRVCGENLQAKHSIAYTFKSREEMFQVFGIYGDDNGVDTCFGWSWVEEFCDKIGIPHVPVIYRGKYDKDKILEVFAVGTLCIV